LMVLPTFVSTLMRNSSCSSRPSTSVATCTPHCKMPCPPCT
jgi:hypothetical protein